MRRSAVRGAMLLTAASFCWTVRGRMRKVLVVSKENSRDKDKCKVEKLLKTVQNKKWNNDVGRKLKWTPGRYSADGDKWRKRKWREELQTDGETDTWMNIQKEEEGCERDKSDRVRREKRGRGRQKIQTSQRLMSEGASTDGQQGKWDTFTWLSCSMWTSSHVYKPLSPTAAGSTAPLPSTSVKSRILAPPDTSWRPLGAELSLGSAAYQQISSTLGRFILFWTSQPRKKWAF